METIISACGLLCSRCDAFRATLANDPAKLELVAADWRVRYQNGDITAANVRCNGCMVEGGPKCGHCESGCGVRKCALDKKHSTCAECASFPCEQLDGLYGFMGAQGKLNRQLLEAVRGVKGAMHSAF